MTHSLPSHINPEHCVACHQPTLEEARSALASADHDEAKAALISWVTPDTVEHYPQEILAVCIALIEVGHLDGVSAALAQYLTHSPEDEGVMGFLALALALDTRLDEAEVVITEAIKLMHYQARSSSDARTVLHDIARHIKEMLIMRDGAQISEGVLNDPADTHRHQLDHLKSVGLDMHQMQVFGLDSDVDDTIKDVYVADVVKMIDQQTHSTMSGAATLVNQVVDLDDGLEESKITEIIAREAESKPRVDSANDLLNDTAQIRREDILRAERGSRQDLQDDSSRYVFDESLLSELGLSAIHDLSTDTSELDSSLLNQLEKFANTGSITATSTSNESDEDTLKHPVVGQVTDYALLSEISDSMLSELDLSFDESLSPNTAQAVGMRGHQELVKPSVDQREAILIDHGTTPWVKPKSDVTRSNMAQAPSIPQALQAPAPPHRSDSPSPSLSAPPPSAPPQRSLPQETSAHSAAPIGSPLESLQPPTMESLPPQRLSNPPSGLAPPVIRRDLDQRGDQGSALQRLVEGELQLDHLPTPIAPVESSRQSSAQLRGRQQQGVQLPDELVDNERERDTISRWKLRALSLVCLLASFVALASAFHSKSAHLLRRAHVHSYTLKPESYQRIEGKLQANVSHPIGYALDTLWPVIGDSPLGKRRAEVLHKLAWFSTARWILLGESESQTTAMDALKRALLADASQVEGRAALALALWLGGQDTAARATARALPQDEWRRGLVLGWIEWQAQRPDLARERLTQSYRRNPHCELSGLLLALIGAERGLAQAMPYAQQGSQSLSSEALSSFSPKLLDSDGKATWATAKRLTYLRRQSPQMQRELLRNIIPVLLQRGDRVGLQSLLSELSLSPSSPSPLLLPTFIIYLTELDLKNAEQVLAEAERRFELGLLNGEDLLATRSLWASLTLSTPSDKLHLSSLPTPQIAKELGRIAGPQVQALIKPTYQVRPESVKMTRALVSLGAGEWVQLERVTVDPVPKDSQSRLWRQLSSLARTSINAAHTNARPTLELLERDASTLESSLLTQPALLNGILAAQIDPKYQGNMTLKGYEQQTEIKLFKWLSRAWRCRTLSTVSALGQWSQTCESALSENPLDQSSRQHLALALEELGKPASALEMIRGLGMHSLEPQTYRMKMRLAPKGEVGQPPTNLSYYAELLSAERQLRLSTFTQLVQREYPRLNRHEVYRATWVVEAFESPQAARALTQYAIQSGSTLAELDLKRLQLIERAAQGERPSAQDELPSELKYLASVDLFNDFAALYNALRCLSQERALDPHHKHQKLNQSLNNSGDALRRIRRGPPPKRCANVISAALTMKETHEKHIPLVSLSYAQLLISLGKVERAQLILKSLIQREPTQMEARLAYALLLMRQGGRIKTVEIRDQLGPLLDSTQGARLPLAMHEKLGLSGGL